MSSLTRASDASDARRSHRSVEGDEKPHKMRERHRQTATKPRYYIRGIEITAQTGLGRTGGGGGPRPRLRPPESCRSHGPRSCQLARYPRTTPAILTASLPVLSRRFRADPHEIGRIEGIGPDLWKPVSSSTMTSTSRAAPVRSLTRASTSRAAGELVDQGQRRPRAGHCRRLWERLWGWRLELGANTYRVLVLPTPLLGSVDISRYSAFPCHCE